MCGAARVIVGCGVHCVVGRRVLVQRSGDVFCADLDKKKRGENEIGMAITGCRFGFGKTMLL